MAVTEATFVARFPEYKDAPGTLVADTLAVVVLRYAGDLTTAERDDLVMLRTADELARSPFARDLKLTQADGTTVYTEPLKKRTREIATLKRRTT